VSVTKKKVFYHSHLVIRFEAGVAVEAAEAVEAGAFGRACNLANISITSFPH
jgi:hypothetical protein